ncbi:cyclin-like protein [Scleroderma citrinum]
MSSNIPTRRVTRQTRAIAQKDNENATARTTRTTTRSKPPSNSGALPPASNAPTRATAPTLASRAKVGAKDENKIDLAAQGKRKREALGEVTKNVTKSVAVASKETKTQKFDGVVIKTTATSRQPLRTVAGHTARRTTKPSTAPSQIHPLEEIKEEHAKEVVKAVTIEAPPREIKMTVEDDRVFKKRRTSSDAPEEVKSFDEQHEVAQALELGVDSEPEADPNGYDWDDLDAEDADDPLMVSEYVSEIFLYMKQVELTTLPNPDYMSSQKELAWSMRGILLDWLVQVHARFRLLPETLFLCINIIDRFLSARVVSLAKLQLVGITCLLIAAKVEEIVAPSVSHFLHCADSSYTEGEILLAERYVLKTLDWNLGYPNAMHYLRRISKADDYDLKARTVGKYLLEVAALEWRLLATPPSLIAAASIWLARLILGHDKWTPNLAHYSSYAESSLIPTANLMLNYILKPIRHESFYKKYAGKRFLKVSVWVREWALERWDEDTQVSLAQDLPKVKALNRAERTRLEAAGVNNRGLDDEELLAHS